MGQKEIEQGGVKTGNFNRRKFITSSAISAAGLFLAGKLDAFALTGEVAADNIKSVNSWKIPHAAYVRKWGLTGKGPCSAIGDSECSTGKPTGLQNYAGGMSVPGLGIPLGGVGAGSFHYNLFGTFGPWNMGGSQSSNYWEMRTLPQGAFHIREEVAGAVGNPIVKTLATRHDNIAPQRNFGGVLPAWNQLNPGDGTYSALYPFGWTTYKTFQSEVSMRFWSPIVAGEDERTSMPVAFFDVDVTNPTSKVITLSVMLTFPNASSHSNGTTRAGLYTKFNTDALTGVSGVTLGSDHATNTPDAHQSEWTIAALNAPNQQLSYATSWNANGDGSDIYDSFSAKGLLPNGAIDQSNSAGAVAVKVQLKPGQKATINFALSWDFPQVYYGEKPTSRAIWMRRYTEFYGAKSTAINDYIPNSYPFKQSFNIAKREIKRHDDSLKSVHQWWKPIAENEKYPEWLSKAALNELYQMVFNASFWEAGLVSTTIVPTPRGQRLGAEIPGTHLFFTIDGGAGGAGANEIDVDSAGYLCYTKLFPNLELGRVRAYLQLIKQNPYGRVPQQFYPGDGPFISATSADQGAPEANAAPILGTPPPPPSTDLGKLFDPKGGDSFRDCPHKVIYRTYVLIKETGDKSLITYAYAPLLKALKHMYFFRPVGSHLPQDPASNNPPNTMDQIPVNGHGIYNCMLHLLSLQILVTLTPQAMALGVAEASAAEQEALTKELAAAKKEFEKIFWNPVTGRYRFCDGTGGLDGRTGNIYGNLKLIPPPDAVFLDSFYAQAIASQLDLPDLINIQNARKHWNNTIDAFLVPKDANGVLTGPPTMLDEKLNYYSMFHFQNQEVAKDDSNLLKGVTGSTKPGTSKGGILPETSEVIPGIAYMATAAAVYIGHKTGDKHLVKKALTMSEAVANMIFDDGGLTTKGMAFGTPESWFIEDTNTCRYTGYSRSRSIWQIIDALEPIRVAK